MDIKEYARKVKEMRRNQRNFFSTKKSKYLYRSKELESEVDKMTAEILDTQMSMFD